MMNQQNIRQAIERYQHAIHAVYGEDYAKQMRIRHVVGNTVSIRFPKGGKVLVERDRLHTLTQFLNAQASLHKAA